MSINSKYINFFLRYGILMSMSQLDGWGGGGQKGEEMNKVG